MNHNAMAATKKTMVVAYLEPDQRDALKLLSEVTRVPQQVYLREAVDMVLARYRNEFKRAKK